MKYKLWQKCTAAAGVLTLLCMQGCTGGPAENEKIQVELVQYKPEAVAAFEEIEHRFNEEHQNIELTISSPNEAATVLKTRFIRGDYPDIIGIGGDMDYANFLDAEMFMDISDWEGLDAIKPVYREMDKALELIPKDGVYAVPYAANCSGILYNKEMFTEHGWEIPKTWSEFIALCEQIQSEGIQPLYAGYKDTWTCYGPWNALAVGLADPDVCEDVSAGKTTFSAEYAETAEKMKLLLQYTEPNPYAYGYNDACTAFARGQSAMYVIGSFAIAQILSANPEMNIGAFTFPANEDESDNILTSGIDLQFSVMKDCENKAAVYAVLDFLNRDDIIQIYLDNQIAVSCKNSGMEIHQQLSEMKPYLDSERVSDFHDHHYPSEMSVDAMIQTYLIDTAENSAEKFLKSFDENWIRYNRDLIRRMNERKEGAEQ